MKTNSDLESLEPNLVLRQAVEQKDGDFMLTILYMYVLQHGIFWAARPILFIAYSILTCCCDKGQDFGDNEEFEDRIISYSYIEKETENHGGFANHSRNPMAEMAYQRDLSQVASRAAAEQEKLVDQKEMSASAIRRASSKMKGVLAHRLSITQKGNTCPICAFEFSPGQQYMALGCHPKHCLHEHCYQELVGFFQQNAACPLCRKSIDQYNVTKQTIQCAPQQAVNPFGPN